MTDEEISDLMIECKTFIQNARDVCGRRISIEEILNEIQKDNAEKYKRAEEASVKNYQRWQHEQSELQRANNERRELQMQDLQAELKRIEERKLAKRMKELQEEKDYLDELEAVEEYQLKKENDTRRKRIEIYQELNENLDKELEHKAAIINDLQTKAKGVDVSSTDPNKDDEVNANCSNGISITSDDREEPVMTTEQQVSNESEISPTKSKLTSAEAEHSTTDEMNNVVGVKTTAQAEAQRNKEKFMSHEHNFSSFSATNDQNGNMGIMSTSAKNLTDAQRNKLKVMRHEFGLIENEKTPKISVDGSDSLTDLQRNRLKVMSGEFFLEVEGRDVPTARLDLLSTSPRFSQILESPVSDIMAMSVTSDHFSAAESSELRDSEKSGENIEVTQSHEDDEENDDELFRAFEEAIEKNSSHFLGADLSRVSSSTSYECVKTTNTLEMSRYLQQSLMIPVNAYMEMLNNETLKMFVENLKIISHFKSLRNYFLMMNGEFSISVCHQLFTKLEKGVKPLELLNYQSLHMILDHALSNARHDENTEQLSFIVKNVPEKFENYSPLVLSCLTLSYKLEWPMNLILNPETMEKYQAIFNYLLKLKRISWVLDECFQLLKTSLRQHGKDLLNSQQYRNVQLIRHKMTHCKLELLLLIF